MQKGALKIVILRGLKVHFFKVKLYNNFYFILQGRKRGLEIVWGLKEAEK